MFRSPHSGASDDAVAAPSGPAARGGELVAAVLLGGALAGVAFGAAAGTTIGRTSTTEILMVVAGALVVAAAILWGRRGPLHGGVALFAFGLLASLTAFSISWAMVPELAYVEAGRTLAYLTAFAAAVAGARLWPRGAGVAVKGIVLAATAAVVYALLARVWPASLAENEISNRIGQPFEYWNAVGTTAALAIPGLLWLGSRRSGSVAGRVLAYPAMAAAMLAILLTQSRGALVAGAIGALLWFAIAPVRLRSLPVLLVPAAGAALVGAWALSKTAFAEAAQPLAAKEAVAGDFGLMLLLMAVLVSAGGLAVNVGLERMSPAVRMRRRLGIALLALACLIPLAAFTSVAFSDRGLGGTISDRVEQLTSETEVAPSEQGAGRFAAVSSTRGKYWREAARVFEERPAVGVGAGNFAPARLMVRTDGSVTRHAHGFVPQTFADLGIVGLVLTGALLLAWLVAAARTTALYPRRFARGAPRRDWDGDRMALVALVLVAAVFGLQSAIDWTWFIPGPAAMALVAAGFTAGRGPAAVLAEPAPRISFRELPGSSRLFAASAVLVAALLVSWAIWQPEAADEATDEAVTLAAQGDVDGALAETVAAEDANPLSAQPLLVRAAILTEAGREDEAGPTLERAVLRFPGDAETWYRLAAFQLGTLEEPAMAAETIQGALFLDAQNHAYRAIFLDARARLREDGGG